MKKRPEDIPRRWLSDPVGQHGESARVDPGRNQARDPDGAPPPPTSLTRPPRAAPEVPQSRDQRDPDAVDEDEEDRAIERNPP